MRGGIPPPGEHLHRIRVMGYLIHPLPNKSFRQSPTGHQTQGGGEFAGVLRRRIPGGNGHAAIICRFRGTKSQKKGRNSPFSCHFYVGKRVNVNSANYRQDRGVERAGDGAGRKNRGSGSGTRNVVQGDL